MSDDMKAKAAPIHVAKIAAILAGSGYITSAQYADLEHAATQDCNSVRAAIEARHAEGIKQAVREAYEDAIKVVHLYKNISAWYERTMFVLREKAGKL